VEELRGRSPNWMSASALADRFEVSTRTIERDLSALQQAGVPIYATPGRRGGYALDTANGVPTSSVSAVAIDIGVTEGTAAGFLTAYSGDSPLPGTSNLNYLTSQSITNGAVVKVGANNTIKVTNTSTGSAHIIIDVQGWYATWTGDAGGTFTPLDPARLTNPKVTVPANGSVDVTVTGVAGIPATGVATVTTNLTVTDVTAAGQLVAYSTGLAAEPGTTNVAFSPAQTIAALSIVKVGGDGKIRQYLDWETGFYYLRARLYDPTTAQFLTRDPAVGMTRQAYSYVGGNPLNRVDPSGLWELPLPPGATGLLGLALGIDCVGSDCNSIAEQNPEISPGVADFSGGLLDGFSFGNFRHTGLGDNVRWNSGPAGAGRWIGWAGQLPFAVGAPRIYGFVDTANALSYVAYNCRAASDLDDRQACLWKSRGTGITLGFGLWASIGGDPVGGAAGWLSNAPTVQDNLP